MREIPAGVTDVEGAAELFQWFGHWPSFHDAEVLSLHLNRKDASLLRVLTWTMSPRLDARGYFELENHVVVSFRIRHIEGLDLADFSSQNVISSLEIAAQDGVYQIVLGGCYGLQGSIHCRQLEMHLTPGIPPSDV